MMGFEPHHHRHHQVVRSLLPTGCRLLITVWTTTNPFCSLLMQGSLLSSSSSRLFNSPFLSFCLIFCYCCSSIPQTKVKLTSRRKKWNFCSSSSFRKRSSRARGLSRVEARTRVQRFSTELTELMKTWIKKVGSTHQILKKVEKKNSAISSKKFK